MSVVALTLSPLFNHLGEWSSPVQALASRFFVLFVCLVACFSLFEAPAAQAYVPASTPNPLDAIAGADRFETAVKVSKASGFGAGGAVFVVTGEVPADALSAGPAAAKEKAPILLARRDSLPSVTNQEVRRLAPSKIFIVGSEDAVGAGVESSLRSIAPNATVTRIAGDNRQATAQRIAERWFGAVGRVLLVNGWSFPDALTAASAGAEAGIPLLMTAEDRLLDETAQFLQSAHPARTTLLGQTTVLRDNVSSAAQQATGGTVDRLAGNDRYATNAAVIHEFFDPARGNGAYITTGVNWPDALVASPVSGRLHRPVFLSTSICSTEASLREMDRFVAGERLTVVGGTLSNYAWRTDCARVNADGSVTPIGLANPDQTVQNIHSFVTKYNLVRAHMGYQPIPYSRIGIGTTCYSEKAAALAWKLASQGSIGGQPNDGSCGPGEAVYFTYTDAPPTNMDVAGDNAAADFWNDRWKRNLIYGQAGGDVNSNPFGQSGCLVFNMTELAGPVKPYAAAANAAWVPCNTPGYVPLTETFPHLSFQTAGPAAYGSYNDAFVASYSVVPGRTIVP